MEHRNRGERQKPLTPVLCVPGTTFVRVMIPKSTCFVQGTDMVMCDMIILDKALPRVGRLALLQVGMLL